MKRFIVALAALALAAAPACASLPRLRRGNLPRIPTIPATQTVHFGSETLRGFGGVTLNNNGGNLIVSGETDGSGAASTDFAIDGNNELVPSFSGSTPSNGGAYGSLGPTYNGPYTVKVVNAAGDSSVVTVDIDPNVSTVKSHFNFAQNPDDPTLNPGFFQLNYAVGANASGYPICGYDATTKASLCIHLGDTVVIRDGSGYTGHTPAVNPLVSAARITPDPYGKNSYLVGSGVYSLNLPWWPYAQGANAGSTITITCETQYVGLLDFNGNEYDGGGCTVGSMAISADIPGGESPPGQGEYYSMYNAHAAPIDFRYVTFERDIPMNISSSTQVNGKTLPFANYTPYTHQFYDNNGAFGAQCHYCRFVLGPAITPEEAGIIVTQGATMYGGVLDHVHFFGAYEGAGFVNIPQYPIPGVTITNSICENLESDCFDVNHSQNYTTPHVGKYNFLLNPNNQLYTAENGDVVVIDNTVNGGLRKSYTFVDKFTGAVDTVPTSPSWARTVANLLCAINAPAVATTYQTEAYGGRPSVSFTCTPGVNYSGQQNAARDATVTAAYRNAFPIWYLDLTVTGSNSLSFATGSTPATTAGYSGFYNPQYSMNKASLIGMGFGPTPSCGNSSYNYCISFSEAHADTWQVMTPPVTGNQAMNGMDYEYNISMRNNATPNADVVQFWFANLYGTTTSGNDCCLNGVTVKNNITHQTATQQINGTLQNNLDVERNTVLSEAEGTGLSVNASTFDSIDFPYTTTRPAGSADAWIVQVQPAQILVPACGATGSPCGQNATFTNNLSNGFSVPTNYVSGSLSISPNPNETIAQTNVSTMPSVTEQQNDCLKLAAFLPNLPVAKFGTCTSLPFQNNTLNNRAAAIKAMAPAVGQTFTGTLQSTGTCGNGLTGICTLQIDPAYTAFAATLKKGMPLNGAGLNDGDTVWSVSGLTVTLFSKANSTAQGDATYATGAMNPDGSYNGALFPPDYKGQICWNDAVAWSYSQDCTLTHTLAH